VNELIANYLSELKFGEPQRFENMEVIPLFVSIDDGPQYLTLKEAMDQNLLVVTEVDHGGSVPELKVANKAKTPVLLLDGEELAGAKQNRVLNTTILLKEKSKTIIPVSCTEQGRWSYMSPEFGESGVIISPQVRSEKAASVTRSLGISGKYDSNQGAVWDMIEEISGQAEVESPTSAMRDVFEAKSGDLDGYLRAFEYIPQQKGLIAFINGEVAGLDILSLASACKILHQKLVKSYAMDALLQKKGKGIASPLDAARTFIKATAECSESKYDSLGHGTDYRFESPKMVGSALVYGDKVIHMAFFRATESSQAGNMTRSGLRRDFRIQRSGWEEAVSDTEAFEPLDGLQ